MLPRLVFGAVMAVLCIVIMKILLIGHKKGTPIPNGCRKFFIKLSYKFTATMQALFAFWTWITYEYVDADYEKYLGKQKNDPETRPNNEKIEGKEKEDKEKPLSMVVCNHSGFLEILALICSPLFPSFTPKKEMEKGPVLGPLCRGLQSLFVPRAGDGRDAAVNAILERQAKISDEKLPYSPLCMFAEGSTTNGSTLMKFKRGAFLSMRPIVPCYIKFGNTLVNPCYDCIDFTSLLVLLLSNFDAYKTTLHIMPTFYPNDYMLENCGQYVDD